MFKNVASQTLTLYAVDASTGLPKTGAAGGLFIAGANAGTTVNITGSLSGSVSSIATGGIATASFAAGATIPRCTLVDTLTTYTNDTPQSGDSFARIGATGSGLTSLAPSATALTSATWTNTRAGYLDNLSGGAVALASGVVLTSAGLDSVVIESGLNARQALSLGTAALVGVLSGAATTSVTILGAGVGTTRVTATVTSDGDRTAVVLNPPA